MWEGWAWNLKEQGDKVAKTGNRVTNAQHLSIPRDSWCVFCVSQDAVRRQSLVPPFCQQAPESRELEVDRTGTATAEPRALGPRAGDGRVVGPLSDLGVWEVEFRAGSLSPSASSLGPPHVAPLLTDLSAPA